MQCFRSIWCCTDLFFLFKLLFVLISKLLILFLGKLSSLKTIRNSTITLRISLPSHYHLLKAVIPSIQLPLRTWSLKSIVNYPMGLISKITQIMNLHRSNNFVWIILLNFTNIFEFISHMNFRRLSNHFNAISKELPVHFYG